MAQDLSFIFHHPSPPPGFSLFSKMPGSAWSRWIWPGGWNLVLSLLWSRCWCSGIDLGTSKGSGEFCLQNLGVNGSRGRICRSSVDWWNLTSVYPAAERPSQCGRLHLRRTISLSFWRRNPSLQITFNRPRWDDGQISNSISTRPDVWGSPNSQLRMRSILWVRNAFSIPAETRPNDYGNKRTPLIFEI